MGIGNSKGLFVYTGTYQSPRGGVNSQTFPSERLEVPGEMGWQGPVFQGRTSLLRYCGV